MHGVVFVPAAPSHAREVCMGERRLKRGRCRLHEQARGRTVAGLRTPMFLCTPARGFLRGWLRHLMLEWCFARVSVALRVSDAMLHEQVRDCAVSGLSERPPYCTPMPVTGKQRRLRKSCAGGRGYTRSAFGWGFGDALRPTVRCRFLRPQKNTTMQRR